MGTIVSIVAPMGGGKTAFATYLIKVDLENNKKRFPASNTPLKFKNAIFSPLMVLDYNNLENADLLFDDIYAIPNIKGVLNIITCLSRKDNVDVIITAQYYTQIDPQMRVLCKYEIEVCMLFFDREGYENESDTEDIELINVNDVYYYKKTNARYEKPYNNWENFHSNIIDIIIVIIHPPNNNIAIIDAFPIVDFLQNVAGLYQTKFKAKFSTDRQILPEILKFSETLDSLDLNLQMYFKNASKREKYFKLLAEKIKQKY